MTHDDAAEDYVKVPCVLIALLSFFLEFAWALVWVELCNELTCKYSRFIFNENDLSEQENYVGVHLIVLLHR